MGKSTPPNKKTRNILLAILIILVLGIGIVAALRPELFTAAVPNFNRSSRSSSTIFRSTSNFDINLSGTLQRLVCGNGAKDSGEDCDDGNKVTETCPYGHAPSAIVHASL
jgi:hypothetical protein